MKNTNSNDMLTVTVSFRLTEREFLVLAERARQESRSLSNVVRMLLRYGQVDNRPRRDVEHCDVNT